MAGDGGEEALKLEFTPTWVVALVCSIIVFISLAVERLLHFLGKVPTPCPLPPFLALRPI